MAETEVAEPKIPPCRMKRYTGYIRVASVKFAKGEPPTLVVSLTGWGIQILDLAQAFNESLLQEPGDAPSLLTINVPQPWEEPEEE